jgi:electron-transferring-flavoprotein dehydrogenase
MESFIPAEFQVSDHIPIITDQSGGEDEFDILIIGAGSAGLSTAIKIAQLDREKGLGKLRIAIIEKAAGIGNHTLSGAVINPIAIKQLFPDIADIELPFSHPVRKESVLVLTKHKAIRLPTPPTMQNHGNYIVSLSDVLKWLAHRAEELGVMILPGFPAAGLLVRGDRVIGVRTADRGRGREGQALPSFQPGMDIRAHVTVLADGVRGILTKTYLSWQNITPQMPQIYAIGVKEVWEVPSSPQGIIHTMGWPLEKGSFGGSFMYPLSENLVSLGLVIGLDDPSESFDPHFLLQKMKTHPLFRKALAGGKRVEWGAKAIPEGGYYSLPSRLSGHGVIIVGDAAGFVNVPALKGVHYAMYSGILAGQTIAAAFERHDDSSDSLLGYDQELKTSFIVNDLYRIRNMRQAFKGGLFQGLLKAGLMYALKGWWPKAIHLPPDNAVPRKSKPIDYPKPDGKLIFSKEDSVAIAGNSTRGDMPSHLSLLDDIPLEVARFYSHLCPAGVYEINANGKLQVNPSNCIDCMTSDILAGRWQPREGATGARYRKM